MSRETWEAVVSDGFGVAIKNDAGQWVRVDPKSVFIYDARQEEPHFYGDDGPPGRVIRDRSWGGTE